MAKPMKSAELIDSDSDSCIADHEIHAVSQSSTPSLGSHTSQTQLADSVTSSRPITPQADRKQKHADGKVQGLEKPGKHVCIFTTNMHAAQ
jgi:hypothetical protein